MRGGTWCGFEGEFVHCWTAVAEGEESGVESQLIWLVVCAAVSTSFLELAGKLHAGQCQRGCSRTQLMGGRAFY